VSDPKVRPSDLGVSFEADGALLVRAPTRGVGARVPPVAIGVLAFCTEPRTEADVARAMGPGAAGLFRALADAELLVDPERAHATPSFFENFSSLDVHRRMLADHVRVDAYAAAIAEVVHEGHRVLDAGTGSGVLAALAARQGATVYAVDNSDAVRWAQGTVEASGLDDRVTVIRGDMATVELPTPVDVIVTETFGALALAEGAAPDLQQTVQRHLADGGRVVPDRVDFYVAAVVDPSVRDEVLGPFERLEGIDMGPLRSAAVHRGVTMPVPAEAVVGQGSCFAEHAFPAAGGEVHGQAVIPAEGLVVGLCAWYDLRLSPKVVLSTAPHAPATHWAQTFLPLAEPVAASGTLSLTLSLCPPPDDRRSLEVEVTGDLTGTWRVR